VRPRLKIFDSDTVNLPDPTVTVLLPVRNGELWIRECLTSILNQTSKDFEVVLIDDGSSDNSVSIALSMNVPQLRVVLGPQAGLARALALGIESARGEFIARQDVDDLSCPERLETQVRAFREDPSMVLLGSSAIEIDSGGGKIGRLRVPKSDRSIRLRGTFVNPFIHTSVMFRRSTALAAGNYSSPSSSPYPEDFDLWGRMLKFGRVRNMTKPLVQYRRTDHGLMAQNARLIGVAAGQVACRNVAEILECAKLSIGDSQLVSMFHWRSRKITLVEAARILALILRIRLKFGLLPMFQGLPIRIYLRPIIWLYKTP